MQMRYQYNVGWAVCQKIRPRILPVALQKENSIPQDRVGQHANLADVYQHGSVSDII
jgi:hypothetical protein